MPIEVARLRRCEAMIASVCVVSAVGMVLVLALTVWLLYGSAAMVGGWSLEGPVLGVVSLLYGRAMWGAVSDWWRYERRGYGPWR
jgi:hypothetical protein